MRPKVFIAGLMFALAVVCGYLLFWVDATRTEVPSADRVFEFRPDIDTAETIIFQASDGRAAHFDSLSPKSNWWGGGFTMRTSGGELECVLALKRVADDRVIGEQRLTIKRDETATCKWVPAHEAR